MSTNDERPGEVDDAERSSADDDDASAPTATESAAAPVAKVATRSKEAKAEIARVRDQLLRTAADFDNFRKRTRRELDDALKRGREELLRELLPVFDNLERAVVHAGQASDAKAVADGVWVWC